MWLESTTAPATVSDDEFLLLPLCIYTGEGKKTRMIHKSGDLPKLTIEINFRREGLLEFGIFYFE